MKFEITPEQRLLMQHALDLAIAEIEDQLHRATPRNKRFGRVYRFSFDGSDPPPLKPNEQRYTLVDLNGRECNVIPKKLAKLMSDGILERLHEYEALKSELSRLSDTPISVRSFNKTEQDELK